MILLIIVYHNKELTKNTNFEAYYKHMGKNIIVVDYPVDGSENSFSTTLSNKTGLQWEILSKVSNQPRTNLFIKVMRYVKYFGVPLALFLNRKNIRNLIAIQQFYGILFAFYCCFFGVKKKTSLIIATFIYNEKKGIPGKLYHYVMSKVVNSKYIDLIICFSEKEIGYYQKILNVRKPVFTFLPLSIPSAGVDDFTIDDERYIFSTGYSCRDYEFLIESLRDTDFKLIIASPGLQDKSSENIKILDNCFGKDMEYMMAHSYCVVIPLSNKIISAGQLVALQAMQMKKPIIATNSDSLKPYIKDGYNGFLIENKKEELVGTLIKLYNDPELYNTISKNGYEEYLTKYSYTTLAENIAIEVLKHTIFFKSL